MDETRDGPSAVNLPAGHAVASVDGSMGPRGAAAGVVFLLGDTVRLRGTALPGVGMSWDAEARAVTCALALAREHEVRHLRLLIDHYGIALNVQGKPSLDKEGNRTFLDVALEEARHHGVRITARVVQGHTETRDLPSRMNDLAHILGDVAIPDGFVLDVPWTGGWTDLLAHTDRRFRPTRTVHRWTSFLHRRRTAQFIGIGTETVDALVRAGHLEVDPRGVARASAARIYVAAQVMRHGAYFGFKDSERVDGSWHDEVSRGWDARGIRADASTDTYDDLSTVTGEEDGMTGSIRP